LGGEKTGIRRARISSPKKRDRANGRRGLLPEHQVNGARKKSQKKTPFLWHKGLHNCEKEEKKLKRPVWKSLLGAPVPTSGLKKSPIKDSKGSRRTLRKKRR